MIALQPRSDRVPLRAAPSGEHTRHEGATTLWLLNTITIAAGVVALVAGVSRLDRLTEGPAMQWWLLTVIFLLANVCIVHVHFRSGAHTIALAEVPLVIGLVLCDPWQLVAAAALGMLIANVVHRRLPIMKVAFNLGMVLVETDVAIAVYRGVLQSAAPISVRGWVAALVAAVVASVASMVLITAAMSLSGDRGRWTSLYRNLPLPLTVTSVNTLVALAGVRQMLADPLSGILVAVPALALWVAYRGYLTEVRKHARVQVLYETSRAFHGSTGVEAVIRVLLSRAHDVFNAETAELTLLPVDSEGLVTRYSLDSSENGFLIAEPCTADAIGAVAIQHQTRLIPRNRSHEPVAGDLHGHGIRDAMLVALRGEGGVFGSLLVGNRRSDVDTFSSDDVELLDAFATQASVSLDNSRLGDELQRLAFQDLLTGLANRALLVQRLGRALLRANEGGSRCAVLFIDIDDFKLVNDSLGHIMGDRLLAAVAARIRGCLRPTDIAARLGGDEFAVLLEAAHGEEAAIALASRLVDRIRAPFVIDGTRLIVHASIGVVVNAAQVEAGPAAVTADEVLSQADVAMYRAKTNGKDRWQLFESSMQTEVLERHQLQRDLERAVDERQFVVHYQPVVTLPEGAVVGVEALVRWTHPTRGMVPPDDFVHAAEDNGLILPIGDFVLRTACAQLASWHETSPDLVLMVNISGRQLHDAGFLERVETILLETGVDPAHLELEVTESVMVLDDPLVRDALRGLRSLGIRLAIDDFGTGYSSLSTLRELPVDVIKIAKPFVDGIDGDIKDLAFATAIVRMAHTLGLAIIAEGVERTGQADQLTQLKCGMAQGWLYSPAVGATELGNMIESGPALTALLSA